MTAAEDNRKRSPMLRVVVVVSIVCIAIVGLTFAIKSARQQAHLHAQRQQAERRQKSFDLVKRGSTRASVMDSKLLPMLANDPDCRRRVTNVDFFMSDIDPADAPSVSKLKNVTSMTFYCTNGTKELLLAARSLPIDDLQFEMPDLLPEDFLILKEFPQLKKVRIEHMMEDEWIARLESELPNVVVEAPYPRSKEPGMAR
ncbi:hypothetical protein [Pirellulimonas nuda]|nr:hypothetical protein [Pirellulimonas nuda]